MRILHLSSLYPPHIVGGAERSVGLLADTQVLAGHSVAAASISPHGWNQEIRHGVQVYRMPHENDFWMEDWPQHTQLAREWAKLKQQANFAIEGHFAEVIDDFKPDIINTHSLVDISTRVWHAARSANVPVVHTLRDYDLLCAASTMYRDTGPCLHRHLKCRILTFSKQFDQKLVSGVTAVGTEVMERHEQAGFFGHIPQTLRKVIWNTAEVAGAAGDGVRPSRDPGEIFTFGYLGRISPEKGVDVLLRAARAMPAAGWQLVIAGTAQGDMEDLRKSAEGLPIQFMGFVDPKEFFDRIDLLVVPSLWAEPLGRSVLESYFMGIPVIGSRTGGIAELVANENWLFSPGDHEMLAKLMRQALRKGRHALPGAFHFASVIERTRPTAVANEFEKLYMNVIHQRAKLPYRKAVVAP